MKQKEKVGRPKKMWNDDVKSTNEMKGGKREKKFQRIN